MSEEIKLKPCPFCGGEARFLKFESEAEPYGFAVCNKCGAMSRPSKMDEAVAAWNRRGGEA